MKIALDLYFKEEFPEALAKRFGLPGRASKDTIRRWCRSVLFTVCQDVLDHPEPPGVEGSTVAPKPEDFKTNDDRVTVSGPEEA
jgi:hypothetical protein